VINFGDAIKKRKSWERSTSKKSRKLEEGIEKIQNCYAKSLVTSNNRKILTAKNLANLIGILNYLKHRSPTSVAFNVLIEQQARRCDRTVPDTQQRTVLRYKTSLMWSRSANELFSYFH
jgi:hypothetical protein